MPQDDLVGDQPVFVFLERRPASKAQPPPGSRGRPKIAEGGDRIGKEHDAKAGGYQIEPVRLEAVDLGISLDQRDIAEPAFRDTLAGAGQHRLGDVDPDDSAPFTDSLGEGHGSGAGAAADLEYAFAGRDLRSCQQEIVDCAHAPLDQAAEQNPARAGNRIPKLVLCSVRDAALGHSKISFGAARWGWPTCSVAAQRGFIAGYP